MIHSNPQEEKPQEKSPKNFRVIISDYAQKFVNLVSEVPETADRIKEIKDDYDFQQFNLVVTSGKPGVGKSQLICGILEEPKLLSPYTTTVYRILHWAASDEPVEDLANLMARGYAELTVDPTNEKINGEIIAETPTTVTLKTGNGERELPKSLSTLVTFDDRKIGQIERDTPDDETIIFKKIDGTTETIDKLDIKPPTPTDLTTPTDFIGKRKQEFTAISKTGKKDDKKIDAQAVANYANRDDVKSILIGLDHNDFLKNHHTWTAIMDTPHLDDLIDDEDRLPYLLSGNAFLFVLNGLITQAEKEALKRLRAITDAIYFVQTKIDTYIETRAWKEQRRSNVQIISEVLDLPPGDIKYFSVSTTEKRKADQTQDPNEKKKALEASNFSQLLEFLEEKLGETDKEINSRSRDFLQELKFEVETFLLHVGLNNEELSKFENWFNETYKPLKATFDQKAADISSDTQTRMSETFGAYGYRPITTEVMDQFRDMKAKRLITEVEEIQRLYVDVCLKKIEPIFLSYIESMDKLCRDIAEQMQRHWEGSVESPAVKLSIRYVDNLRQLPDSVWRRSQTPQSLMYPLMIASGTFEKVFKGVGAAALVEPSGLMALAAGALWSISTVFKVREEEIMQREKTTAEIETILNGILTLAYDNTNRELEKLIRTYRTEMGNEFESFEKEAEEKIRSLGSESQKHQSQKLGAETLLENIDETLKELETSLQ